MKKLLICVIIASFALLVRAQSDTLTMLPYEVWTGRYYTDEYNLSPHYALYVAFTPADYGLGVRGDYHFKTVGTYASVTYGNGGCYNHNNLKHHAKVSVGVLVPLKPIDDYRFYFSTAVNYHSLGKSDNVSLDPKIFNPWSFELGLTTYLKRFAIGVRTDILRWEAGLDCGLTF